MLQGYFDDSTESNNALIFAGYFAPETTWRDFSDEWKALVDGEPRLDAFKMRRMKNNPARAKPYFQLIERFQLTGIGCAVPIVELKNVVQDMGLDPDWANPYYLAWRAVITLCLEGAKMLGAVLPIEFIFDDQTEKVNVRKGWNYFHGNAPRHARQQIVGIPRFEKDDHAVPLQAADLLAWWARRQYLDNPQSMRDLFPADWTNGKAPTLLFAHLPEAAIREQFAKDVKAARDHFWLIELQANLLKTLVARG